MPYKNKKDITKYNKKYYENNKEKLHAYVKSHGNKKRKHLKLFVNRFKLFVGCKHCGYKKCPTALEFHHLNPKEKDNNIGRFINRTTSIEAVKKEIRKCIVLCSNCHREEHEKLKNTGL